MHRWLFCTSEHIFRLKGRGFRIAFKNCMVVCWIRVREGSAQHTSHQIVHTRCYSQLTVSILRLPQLRRHRAAASCMPLGRGVTGGHPAIPQAVLVRRRTVVRLHCAWHTYNTGTQLKYPRAKCRCLSFVLQQSFFHVATVFLSCCVMPSVLDSLL